MDTSISVKSRRRFIKTLSISGLFFSGIEGFSFTQKKTGTTKVKHWDVIVIGGGPGGVSALSQRQFIRRGQFMNCPENFSLKLT